MGLGKTVITVAPHVGAWIEIAKRAYKRMERDVAPHVGAWIEIAG